MKTATQGHNSGLDPAQERAFIREFASIKDAESEIAESRGTLSGIYKRLETAGFEKDDIKFAKSLEKQNVSEVIAKLKRWLGIAFIMGHPVSRQMEMFEKDRTPLEDAAYFEGLGSGRLRRPNANPYDMSSAPGQAWLRGFHEGTAEANKALAEAMGETISPGTDDDFMKAEGQGETTDDEAWERAAPEAAE